MAVNACQKAAIWSAKRKLHLKLYPVSLNAHFTGAYRANWYASGDAPLGKSVRPGRFWHVRDASRRVSENPDSTRPVGLPIQFFTRPPTIFTRQCRSDVPYCWTLWSLGTERLHVFKNMCSGIEHNLNTNNATDIEHLERVL